MAIFSTSSGSGNHPATDVSVFEDMRQPALNQKTRFILLFVDVLVLCAASWFAFGSAFPANNDKGFWFYTALLGLVLGSRLDTPFYVSPADVVLYTTPAAIALVLGNAWASWSEGVRVGYCIAMVTCVMLGVIGGFAILTKDSKHDAWRRASNISRVLAEMLGTPRVIYSVVIAFALFAFHFSSPKEFSVIASAWLLTGVFSPIEGLLRLSRRVRRILQPNVIFDADGEVIAYQTPGLILIRESLGATLATGDVIAVNDVLGNSRLTLALDHVGRDEGLLLRAIEIPGAAISDELQEQLSAVLPNAATRVASPDEAIAQNALVKSKSSLVGLVAPETSIERLYFEVVKDEGLEEGRLVEVQIGQRSVTYQLVNGLTKEEIVQQKNTHGFARAQAQKIGEWNAAGHCFKFVKWLPAPNAPVFLRGAADFHPTCDAVGHFPGTDCPVSLKSVHDLVTHNTAILGILGIGKSMLAMELVERMMSAGIKVICVDLTNEYSSQLAAYIDTAKEAAVLVELQATGADGKNKVHQNVEEGGSVTAFAAAVGIKIREFMNPADASRLIVFNPTHFEVWRQDSKPFSGKASMASLSPAEITHIVSQATLEAAAVLGITDKARACLVYEEAHSLVPEWNSAVADGDKSASNGSARAILQG
ncbi:MAG: ATP-binding protein, partial [Verrucomicrobiota bacterium]|nr:ATP-binding protein [Verrucomicrobiota bacterium]